jgi:hypothetical protein
MLFISTPQQVEKLRNGGIATADMGDYNNIASTRLTDPCQN